jgi:hypothetical protein
VDRCTSPWNFARTILSQACPVAMVASVSALMEMAVHRLVVRLALKQTSIVARLQAATAARSASEEMATLVLTSIVTISSRRPPRMDVCSTAMIWTSSFQGFKIFRLTQVLEEDRVRIARVRTTP